MSLAVRFEEVAVARVGQGTATVGGEAPRSTRRRANQGCE
jgi:hypothetical protein